MEQENNNIERVEKRKEEKKGSKATLIVITILFLLILGVWIWLKFLMPDYLFDQGKKYYNLGQYEKALHMFDLAANAKPYDSEPVYYQALALSKLPPTYENQKRLYDISQLEDCDKANEVAEDVLANMRNQLLQQVGPNYADNILFNDELVRWNNSRPITYSINGGGVPDEYIESVKQALMEWQTVTNGEINFKETMGNPNANINISFVDDLPMNSNYDPSRVGRTEPQIDNNTLRSMKVSLKKNDSHGNPYNLDQLYTLALHEIGHALGLGGHSAEYDDVMYHNGDYTNDDINYRKGITERDLNTLRLLYRMIPDVIDTPIPESEYNNLFYHEVITAYPGENFEREIQRLLGELQNDRKNIITWVDLAINYAYKKQYAKSNFILDNALPLVSADLPNQQVVLYNLAANYYKLKDYEASSRHLGMAEHIKADFDTNLLSSFLDVRQGRLDIAQTKLETILQKYPDNIDVALKLAEVFHIKHDNKAEKQTIEDFLKRNPDAIKDRRIKKYKAQKKTFLSTKDAAAK